MAICFSVVNFIGGLVADRFDACVVDVFRSLEARFALRRLEACFALRRLEAGSALRRLEAGFALGRLEA